MDAIVRKWTTSVHFYKVKLLVILPFIESAIVAQCCGWDCPIGVGRMSSEVHVKSEKYKSKLQQIFVTCCSQFCAKFALFIVTGTFLVNLKCLEMELGEQIQTG